MRHPALVTGIDSAASSRASQAPFASRWRWWLFYLALGTFALGIRIYYITHAVVFQPVYVAGFHGDCVQYYHYALNLVRYSIFSEAPPEVAAPSPDSYRDPGYPVFLAGLLTFVKPWNVWYAYLLIFQALLSALTVLLWVGVGHRWMPATWLAFCGIAIAVWPHSVAIGSFILSETLLGFLCAASMLLLRIATDRGSTGWTVASGVSFSLAALTNAVLLPFAALLGIHMWLQRRMTARTAAIFIGSALCVLAPWSIRNMLLPPGHISSTARAAENLVDGSWPQYHTAFMAWARNENGEASDTYIKINQEVDAAKAHPLAGAAAVWRRIESSPWEYARWYLTKPFLLWDWSIRIGQGDIYVYGTRNSPYDVVPLWRAIYAICHAFNPFLFMLAATGCVIGLRREDIPGAMTATAALLTFITFVYSILQAEPRYSIPYRGPEILLCVYATHRLIEKLKQIRAHRSSVETKAIGSSGSIHISPR
jgi:4-amino-4-deoxy-L-arabinose transferase-like glycosyltransferase